MTTSPMPILLVMLPAMPEKMIFSVAELVSFLSGGMTLEPGDVIMTGTPPGVGLGVKPDPVYLRAGQHIRLGISGLGEQNQRTVDAE